MKKKILIVADRTFPKEMFSEHDISRRLKEMEKLGIEWKIIENDLGDMDHFVAYASKVEKEGPDSVEPCEGLLEEIKDSFGVITSFSAIGREAINQGKNLEFIGVLRSGVEAVNIEVATEKEIPVCFCPGRLADPVADFSVAIMLAQFRNITNTCINLHNGEWKREEKSNAPVKSMKNTWVGLIGFGAIGQKVAKRLQAFGTKVLVYDPFCSDEKVKEAGCIPLSLEDVLSHADIVSVHARLTKDTENLIGKAEFDKMKSTAIFVNTARAGMVNEEALLEALREKKIAGAALDVFHKEPLPADYPLVTMENVTLTPHLAGFTDDTNLTTLNILFEDIENYIAGKTLENEFKVR